MPIGSPFHPRTSALCESHQWRDWSGFYAVTHYDTNHDREYFAYRHSVGVMDVTPLYKYDVKGSDAGIFLSRIMSKNVQKLKQHQVTYLCWCDDDGKIVDDGTVTRMDENWYRVTAADPSYSWFMQFARHFDVEVTDITNDYGILALQGPNSRDLLKACTNADMDNIRFFRSAPAKLNTGEDIVISRTGYTGDLGYEVWVKNDNATKLWDTVMAEGKNYGALPAGLDALDVTRNEAGFIMNGVDYTGSIHCMNEERKSTPYELGLGWTVKTDREEFVGQQALIKEKEAGSRRVLVGLDISWTDLEDAYEEYNLPPQLCNQAWRGVHPIYNKFGTWIGFACSGSWSPILKKNLALAQISPEYAATGTEVLFETVIEYKRTTLSAEVVKTPFYNPERKRK
jgi:aminomethyltransferase